MSNVNPAELEAAPQDGGPLPQPSGDSANTPSTLAKRVAEVEDRLAIRQLISRYCFAVDNHDINALASLFTENASFGSASGGMGAVGRAAVLAQFKDRFRALGPGQHFNHDQVIEFESATRARGRVSLHAELMRDGRAMIGAVRYTDIYEKQNGEWRFAERVLSFMYYLPVEEYASAMGRLDRNRASGKLLPADWPEGLPTWVDYRKKAIET